SLYQEELKVKTQFAKYKYDNTRARESLLELESAKVQAELKASQLRNRAVITLFIFLLVLLGAFFLGYRSRQRAKRLIEANKTARMEASMETEAELSRKLHDDFGAGLNQAMLMVQRNAGGDQVLELLDRLYTMSRNISRDLNEVESGPGFKEEFLEMLRSRTPEQVRLILIGHKDLDWDGMAPLAKVALYKVMLELMINMGKHSRAKMVIITFKLEAGNLKVDYSDDGVGADDGQLALKNGLKNTEKRIKAIGGTIIFDSKVGDGFRADLTIPY